jgi:FecR-like protein
MSHVCDGRDRACASCQAIAHRLATVRGAMTVDDDLDDIRRARIWTQLEDRLAESAPVRRPWRGWAFGGVAAAAVAAAAVVALWPHRDELHTLTVPVDTVVASQLGPHTAASIVGPAELELLAGAGDATAVRLHRGTLLAEFEGGAGRSLRIESRGAVVEVVGTLFAVEVRGGTTCTSVVHGRVRMTSVSGAVFVGGGERHCTGDGDAVRPITDDIRTALLRHSERHELAARAAGAPRPGVEQASSRIAAAPAQPVQPAQPAQPDIDPPAKQRVASRDDADSAARVLQSADVPPRAVAGPPPAVIRSPQAADASPPAVARSPQAADASPPAVPRSPQAADASPPAVSRSPQAADASPPAVSRSPQAADGSPPAAPRSPQAVAGSPPADGPARAAAVPAAPPKPTPDELYRTAEAALAARDLVAADRALAALVTEYASSSLVDEALYERARIAYQQRAWGAARSHLAQLAGTSSAQFAEPGHYLRCRIAVETGESTASACLVDYRARFARSPHDLDALALLVQLAHASQGCRGAAALIDELVQSYPRTTLAAAWRGRCSESR